MSQERDALIAMNQYLQDLVRYQGRAHSASWVLLRHLLEPDAYPLDAETIAKHLDALVQPPLPPDLPAEWGRGEVEEVTCTLSSEMMTENAASVVADEARVLLRDLGFDIACVEVINDPGTFYFQLRFFWKKSELETRSDVEFYAHCEVVIQKVLTKLG